MYGAKQVKQADLPELYGIVGNLAKGEDTMPKLTHRELEPTLFPPAGTRSCRGRRPTGILGIS